MTLLRAFGATLGMTNEGARLAVAAIAAIMASYSLLFGFGAWMTGAIVLLARRSWAALALWIVTALIVLAVFLIGYHAPSDDPGWKITLAHPLAIVTFVLVYLGAPLASWAGPLASGICGVALILGWIVSWNRRLEQAPWYGLAGFVIVAAVLEAIGRAANGLGSALASHYTTTSTLGLIALVGASSQRYVRPALATLSLIGSCVGAVSLVILHGYQEDARDALLAIGARSETSVQGYPLWSQIRPREVERLRATGDGPFRGAPPAARTTLAPLANFPPRAAPWLYDTDPPQIVTVAISPVRVRSGDVAAMRVVTTTNVAAVTVALGPIAANLPRRAPGIFEGRAPIPRYPEIPLIFPREADLVVIATNSQGIRAFSSIPVQLL